MIKNAGKVIKNAGAHMRSRGEDKGIEAGYSAGMEEGSRVVSR